MNIKMATPIAPAQARWRRSSQAETDASDYGDKHQIIRHADHEYVVGAVHTNTIEGFWSIFKRSLSPKPSQ